MRIGIYDPYLNTLGGGEKYILAATVHLSKKHDVFVFSNDNAFIKKAKDRFNLDLSGIKLEKNIFSGNTSFLKKFLNTRRFDLILYISDGSIPFLFSGKNILLFQFPVNWVNGSALLTKLKLRKIDHVICYSNFVKKFIDKTFSIQSIILPPPVGINGSRTLKKEKIILSVGRFTKAINEKKQEVLINVFKKMCDSGLKEWKLVLIGSVLEEDKDFIKKLKEDSKGYPIEILENISFSSLSDYYKKAKIYWHAAGFGEDLEKHPEKAEHFGISTVEAMEQGLVPVVINAGAQPEIVTDKESGFLWDTEEELIKKTKILIDDKNIWEEMSKNAVKKAGVFNVKRFEDGFDKLIKNEK